MKIIREFDVEPNNIVSFMESCRHNHIRNYSTKWDAENKIFHCTMDVNESYYESVISDLLELAESQDTYETRDSIYCAIASIRTLLDLQIIK